MRKPLERTIAMKNATYKIVALLSLLTILFWAGPASAQDDAPYECDDNFGECGTPEQSGGGCGCGGGGSILVNNTDLGDTYQYADDYDDDGSEDPYDNCPFVSNRDQADDDGDEVGTACDNCPNTSNEDQSDLDGDGIGDACDDDRDGDGVGNGEDNCPDNPNPPIDGEQRDADGDGAGNACDDDMDDDGVPNMEDNCPLVANADEQTGVSEHGEACDDDDDGDGIRNTNDMCPLVWEAEQLDHDGDNLGDACDPDSDGDGIANLLDNCPIMPNPKQLDLDRDRVGEACDDLFCYVVMEDFDSCLDPTDPFVVYSPDALGETGGDVKLRLFANRQNQPIRYTWEIVEAPNGSSATIDNPVGAASISTPYEYHYLNDRNVAFSPDKPGNYKIHVVAELVWEDEETGQTGAVAESFSIIEVTGEALDTMSCSTAPVGMKRTGLVGLIPLLLLGLGLVAARRR